MTAVAADGAIARRAFRQVRIGAVAWALVFGATVASSALTYVSTFPDAASRAQVAAATRGDAGLAILLGPITAIDTVAGYTVYKCFVFLTTMGAVWGVLIATRLLRGEEDAGRWQLVLAGGTRASRATAVTLGALGAAVAVVFAGTAAITALAGRNPDVGFTVAGSLAYATSVSIAPAFFVAVGAVTSQLARTRRLATGIAMGVAGAAFVVRMIADSSASTHWLLWLTPFGWTERMRPLTNTDLRPLAVAAVVVAVLCGLAVALSSRRDSGAGILATNDVVAPRPLGLRSPLGLAARMEAPVVIGWWVGLAAGGLAFGIIAKIATGSLPKSMADVFGRIGLQGTFLRQFFGVVFLMVAALVALVPASQIGAAAEEETSGRLVHVLVHPVRRSALLAGRLLLATGAVVGAAVVSGVAAWCGARLQGVDPGFVRMLGAGVNVVPMAMVVLGLAAVTLSVAPRYAARSTYVVVIWSLLVDLFSSIIVRLHSLERLSLLHYMALAPAQPVDLRTAGTTVAIGAGLCAIAVALYGRRDLHTP